MRTLTVGQTLLDYASRLFSGAETFSFQPDKVRDLSVINLDGNTLLVIACDSDGGIGPKELDTVPCSGYVLGRLAARVPLLEMLASGARPILMVNCLAVEMHPSGKEIIAGIRKEAAEAGLDPLRGITGSTEDNVPTRQTGVGVVALGVVSQRAFRPGSSQSGDLVYRLGVPKSAPRYRVTPDDPETMDVPSILEMCRCTGIHDVLAVGSKGIEYEADELARSSTLQFEKSSDLSIDWRISAGPATCVLVSIAPKAAAAFEKQAAKPCLQIGYLR